MNYSRKALGAGAALALAVVPVSGAAAASLLHSHGYLRHHCRTEVAINVGGGYPTNHKNGVYLQGRKVLLTLNGKPNQAVVKYKWRLEAGKTFCGIVGVWFGPDYRSLRPTSESGNRRSGEYRDLSVEKPGEDLQEFIIYAR